MLTLPHIFSEEKNKSLLGHVGFPAAKRCRTMISQRLHLGFRCWIEDFHATCFIQMHEGPLVKVQHSLVLIKPPRNINLPSN